MNVETQGKSTCPHCRQITTSGTHNGCGNCGKVKHTGNGRKEEKKK